MITTSFEQLFEEVINLMPPHKDDNNNETKIRFSWGSQIKLNEFMMLPETISKYPLIWLIEDKDNEDSIRETISRRAKIIIASNSQGVSRASRDVFDLEFKGLLNPIKNNLITALERSGISRINPDYTVQRIQEYQWNNVNNENATGDVWMVIYLEIDVLFETRKCINTNIKF